MATDELVVGEVVTRRELHKRFGGTPQGGISPSAKSQMVMVFVADNPGPHDPLTGWGEDGIFHFTGAGMYGDQEMTRGNLALLRHVENGRALHVFHQLPKITEGVSLRTYRHLGRFEVDPEQPCYTADALDASGDMRAVIVFRLRPVGATAAGGPRLPATPAAETRVLRALPEPHIEPIRLRAQESPRALTARLTADYASHLRSLGRELSAVQVRVKGETRTSYIDLLDVTENRLIEVKNSSTRQSVRLAIGQLMDYRRFFNPTPALALLLPSAPREDLLDLCASLCIEVVWPTPEGGFVSTHD
ncbi:restriction endonuclease [Streptomyces flavofungini]|uniref:restriction endonuclease n=1 Tax=Streptomyces flavofungini TaxID=68200 RepID=UPI0025B25B31|nr:restriction endonuclease [Streptomyces flavofungini]WJV48873.1 restriction endonuclease [Streptomyces flavofungini]